MIALIGGAGSIGKRYASVLRYLDEPYIIVEKDEEIDPDLWEKAIIATPTPTHFEIAEFCNSRNIPFLLEKPPCTDLKQAEEMSAFKGEGYIVNNYAFLAECDWYPEEVKTISYNFFNTGRDGIAWDLSQLIYLAKLNGATVEGKADLPEWTMKVNGLPVPYQDLQATYIDMIRSFISGESGMLWSIREAYAFVKSVLEVDVSNPNYFKHEFKL